MSTPEQSAVDQATELFLSGEISWAEFAERVGCDANPPEPELQYPRPLSGPPGLVGPAKYALFRLLTR